MSLLSFVLMIALQLLRLSKCLLPFSTLIEESEQQYTKASFSIVVTVLETVSFWAFLQLQKADRPIFFTPSGINISVRPKQR